MISQEEFDFTSPPPPVPAGEVELLTAWLAAHPGFHTAKQLAAALQLTDRKIRQIAEASDGMIVSGPGSPGYCHLHHCPAEKLGHIASTMISQARAMIRRALRIRKRAHGIIR